MKYSAQSESNKYSADYVGDVQNARYFNVLDMIWVAIFAVALKKVILSAVSVIGDGMGQRAVRYIKKALDNAEELENRLSRVARYKEVRSIYKRVKKMLVELRVLYTEATMHHMNQKKLSSVGDGRWAEQTIDSTNQDISTANAFKQQLKNIAKKLDVIEEEAKSANESLKARTGKTFSK